METIKNYLDSMFKGLGNSHQIIKAKEELLSMMEDKYQQLIDDGSSENAAIGQVISEFGNLDELADILGIQENLEKRSMKPVVDLEQAQSLVNDYKHAYPKIALGVLIIMLSTIPLFTLTGLSELSNVNLSAEVASGIGLLVVIVGVSIAIYIFLNSVAILNNYRSLLLDDFILDKQTQQLVTSQQKEIRSTYNKSIALSVILFICSSIPLIMSELIKTPWFVVFGAVILIAFLALTKEYFLIPVYLIICGLIITLVFNYTYNPTMGLAMTITMVSAGVYHLVSKNGEQTAYNRLLLEDSEYSPRTKADKKIDAISEIYWILVVGIFFAYSFITQDWGRSWIIWPIAAMLFGAISAFISYKSEETQ